MCTISSFIGYRKCLWTVTNSSCRFDGTTVHCTTFTHLWRKGMISPIEATKKIKSRNEILWWAYHRRCHHWIQYVSFSCRKLRWKMMIVLLTTTKCLLIEISTNNFPPIEFIYICRPQFGTMKEIHHFIWLAEIMNYNR